MAFLGGFAGGLVAGAALVYSIVMRSGQTASEEVKKIEPAAMPAQGP